LTNCTVSYGFVFTSDKFLALSSKQYNGCNNTKLVTHVPMTKSSKWNKRLKAGGLVVYIVRDALLTVLQ